MWQYHDICNNTMIFKINTTPSSIFWYCPEHSQYSSYNIVSYVFNHKGDIILEIGYHVKSQMHTYVYEVGSEMKVRYTYQNYEKVANFLHGSYYDSNNVSYAETNRYTQMHTHTIDIKHQCSAPLSIYAHTHTPGTSTCTCTHTLI